MDRRQFVKVSAAGMGTFTGGLSIEDLKSSMASEPGSVPDRPSTNRIGRPVRVVSIGFTPGRPLAARGGKGSFRSNQMSQV